MTVRMWLAIILGICGFAYGLFIGEAHTVAISTLLILLGLVDERQLSKS